MIMLSSGAYSAVTGVTSAPGKISVPAKGPASITVTWSVVDTGGVAGPVTITSASALLQVSGSTIATLGSSLSRTISLAAGETRIVTFSETYAISPALAQRLSREGAGTVTVRRVFTDGAGTQIGVIPVSTSNTGALSIRRIELKFENDARTDIVKTGEVLRAIADVSFRSNGLLRGEWRLIDPTASLGGTSSGRRVMQVVRQQLVSSGEGRTRIVSPPLPTDMSGLYLVSFSVEDTDGNISVPILRYFVMDGNEKDVPVNVDVLTPADRASFHDDMVFSWNPLAGAQAYQVEIFNADSHQLVAAKIVPGQDLKLSLSTLSLEDIVSGQSYNWRVRAFSGGKPVGTSRLYSLTKK